VAAFRARTRTTCSIGPPWIVLLLAASKRVHSLFVLRLFNDCVAMLLAYAAVALFQRRRWLAGCVVYSCGIGIKMNLLLFAPGLLFLLVRNAGVARTIGAGLVMVSVQVRDSLR
jgi:alpha-1,3-mannosyltransferase